MSYVIKNEKLAAAAGWTTLILFVAIGATEGFLLGVIAEEEGKLKAFLPLLGAIIGGVYGRFEGRTAGNRVFAWKTKE